jgi:hypothetical protein
MLHVGNQHPFKLLSVVVDLELGWITIAHFLPLY